MAFDRLYGIKEVLFNFRRYPARFLVSLLTISLSLLLLGAFLCLTFNLKLTLQNLRAKVEIEAFLKDGITQSQMEELAGRVRLIQGVKDAILITKEEALLDLQREFGKEFIDDLGANPLPPSLRVRLREGWRKGEIVQGIAARIDSLDGVEDVEYGGKWLERLDRFVFHLLLLDLILGVIIGLSSFMSVSNVVSRTFLARRKEVEIMRLVGATRRFIQRPFLYEGLFQGFLGGVIGAALLYLFFLLLSPQLPSEAILSPKVLGLQVGLGLAFGGLGGRFSFGR